MWSSSRNDNLKKGFVLPLTLILLTFGSLMVFIAGIQVSRTTDKIHSYNIVADQQAVSSNVVELVAHLYLNDSEAGSQESWDGLEDFKDYVKNRGGITGTGWFDYLNKIDGEEYINFTENVSAYQDEKGFGEGKYELAAYLYSIEDDKLIIGVADKDGRKRYSVGLVSRVFISGLPAARLGNLPRVLSEMNTKKQGHDIILIGGDLIYGSAMILDDVYLDTENATPLGVINPSLEASGVYVDGELIGLSDYPDWFTATSTENASVIIESWKEEHLASLPDASMTSYINNQTTLPSTFNGDTLYIIDATPTSVDGYELYFKDEGLTISYGGKGFTIPSSIAQTEKIHVLINGDIIIRNDQNDLKKISPINGRYSVTANGTISVRTNLVYSEIFHKINNGNGESEVLNQTQDNINDLINDMMDLNQTDELDLVSIGGNVLLDYFDQGQSTHGMKFLSGNIMAFEEDGIGGDITFVGLENIHTQGLKHVSQFFVFGSLTANTFDDSGITSDYLESLILVANNLSDNTSGLSGELQLMGMRTW
jgi:hypothetical protein